VKFVVDVTASKQDFSPVSSAFCRSLYSFTDPHSFNVTPEVGDSPDQAALYRVCFKLLSLDSLVSLVTT
jgi:hypothetical protein